MTTPNERIRELSAAVTEARRQLADAIAQRDEEICKAIDQYGMTPAEVGHAAGLHKSSLSRILWAADTTAVL